MEGFLLSMLKDLGCVFSAQKKEEEKARPIRWFSG